MWDKVGDIKKYLTSATPPKDEEEKKIRQEIKRFHKKHPEFMKHLDEERKK